MAFRGTERREQILKILNSSGEPVAGTDLAKELGVSRQVIVQTLDLIQQELSERGFLAKLQDYEPVNFWE